MKKTISCLCLVLGLAACDPNPTPDPSAVEPLSFSAAIARLPNPRDLGPEGLSASRGIKPFDPTSDEKADYIPQLYIDLFQNGSMDMTIASYYGEIKRLLGTLNNTNDISSYDFGEDIYLDATVKMSWASTSSGYRVLASMTMVETPEVIIQIALNVGNAEDSLAFDICMSFAASSGGDGLEQYYVASYDELNGTFDILALMRYVAQDGEVRGLYSVKRNGDGTMDLGAYSVTRRLSTAELLAPEEKNYGFASLAGAVYAYYAPDFSDRYYFDGSGIDFYNKTKRYDATENDYVPADSYRLDAMKTWPARLCFRDDEQTNGVFIDNNSNSTYESEVDTLFSDAYVAATYPANSTNEIYVPRYICRTAGSYRPYIYTEPGTLPTYEGTTYELKDGLWALKESLDNAIESRSEAFIATIEARDTAFFDELIELAGSYTYP